MMQTMVNPNTDIALKHDREDHTISFTVKCYATYRSSLTLPKEFFKDGKQVATDDELLTFVRTNLPDAPVDDLEYLEDLEDICDSVWQEDIREVV